MTQPAPQPSPASPQPAADRPGSRALLWFERSCLVAGCLLLLSYAGFRYQQNESAVSGVESFYQQVHSVGLAEPAADQLPTHLPGDLNNNPPEFELWSEKRIREYQESLLQEAAPPLAVLRIERLDIEAPVYNGTDDFDLNRGVGRIKGTAQINADGNLGIAGHRDGFFRGLKDIKQGDVLKLETIHGEMRYRVGSTVIVDPGDVSVLAPTTERTLTLVTCYPFYFVGHAPKRFIVRATAEPQIAMN